MALGIFCILVIFAILATHHFDWDGWIIALFIIIIAIIYGAHWYINNTETGKRLIKDIQSDISGGITRHIRVYDFNGDIIEEYKGTFDIETNNPNYILFDDENGLRHIIYFTTGTVIVDELEKTNK